MVGLVETMMTADGLRLTAFGLGRMQHRKQVGPVSRGPMADMRQIAAADEQTDEPV